MRQVLNGNKSAAYGAKLCRPEILAVYPITPQTTVSEYLCQFKANGELDSTIVEAESEHSVMSILTGAAMAGSRVFTATSGQGLLYMCEPYVRVSTCRLPIVMCIVNREIISPTTVWCGHQDAITLRDGGWIQIFVENNQEILDTIIMAFKVAEDPEIMLPINVCYDGFYLSHMVDIVEVPGQEVVDRFLPSYKPNQLVLDPDNPMAIDPGTPGDLLTEFRYKHLVAMEKAKERIGQVDREFAETFGRSYGGLIEAYRCEDADYLLFTMGSATGTARVAIDHAREKGIPFGLVKVRSLRPFPVKELAKVAQGKKAIGIVDRNVSFGWNSGTLFMETRSAFLAEKVNLRMLDFIAGLGGSDIRVDQIEDCMKKVVQAGGAKLDQEVYWVGAEL
jgi:pyruvate ferredoxin oxidoreductase alpha subunit/phenylglyoxylate dehydrogenase alpha subunit